MLNNLEISKPCLKEIPGAQKNNKEILWSTSWKGQKYTMNDR